MGCEAVLIQQMYPDGTYRCLAELTHERHWRYCKQHGLEYQFVESDLGYPMETGGWTKVELVRRALQEYQYVIWMDLDAYIYDLQIDLREACPLEGVGAVRFDRNVNPHFNIGVLYFSSSPDTTAFVREWQAGFPGPDKGHEQAVFNQLPGIVALPSKWNATPERHEIREIVVAGFHSVRGIENKYKAMQKEFE